MCSRNIIFQEAYAHCRWKGNLNKFIKDENYRNKNFNDKNFKSIFIEVWKKSKNYKGVGKLSVYDITIDICNKYNIIIDKIFIIGNGPKRAIKLLNIKPSKEKFGDIYLKYVTIPDVIEAFGDYKFDKKLSLNNGDEWESWLCNWQKNI